MLIKFTKELAQSIDDGKLDRFGIDVDQFRYGTTSIGISIDSWDKKKIIELQRMISNSKVFGAKVCAKDLKYWLESLEEIEKAGDTNEFASMKARKVEFFVTYLRKYFGGKKIHRVYVRDESRGVTFCSYIYDIDYHPKSKDRNGNTIPEHADLELAWIEFGEIQSRSYVFYDHECGHYRTVKESLKMKNIYLSDKALDRQYEESIAKFNSIAENVGEQYLATGIGTDDVDSETKEERSWWSWYSQSIVLDKGGEPANVVIDLFKETDKESSRRRNRDNDVDTTWWLRNFVSIEDEDSEPDEEVEEEELPVHPNLVIFALRKQVRLRVHVDQLVKYEYDKKMGDKLVLPKESTDLVKTLVSYTGSFNDIIKNKGGGAVILCAGIPGTGKTLTAEVYAEVMEKPLYTVQCSQLGTDPEDLEKQLLIIFARSERWKAILLLDEADVYIHERGNDLNQNAIVGVFLRVMEYYHGVMFMTTNRADMVDDAVASRCIARIEYEVPTVEDAKRIWKVLADVQEISITNETINALVKKYDSMTGRDIKNLLKLAKLTQNGKERSLSVKTIDFVKKFKPTR